jgi:hypothetical protein
MEFTDEELFALFNKGVIEWLKLEIRQMKRLLKLK